MELSEGELKNVVELIKTAIQTGSVRDEASFVELLNFKAKILAHFAPKPAPPKEPAK